MIVTLSKLQQAAPSVAKLAEIKLNLRVAYDLAKIINAINSELEIFEKCRIEKLKELSDDKLTEDGKGYELSEESKIIFNDEINKLLTKEIELNIPQLKLSDFGYIAIEPINLLNLDFLIIE